MTSASVARGYAEPRTTSTDLPSPGQPSRIRRCTTQFRQAFPHLARQRLKDFSRTASYDRKSRWLFFFIDRQFFFFFLGSLEKAGDSVTNPFIWRYAFCRVEMFLLRVNRGEESKLREYYWCCCIWSNATIVGLVCFCWELFFVGKLIELFGFFFGWWGLPN